MLSLFWKPTVLFLFLCLLTTLVVSFHVRPVLHASMKSTLLMSELNSGGFENVYINRIDTCDDNTFGKFKVDTCIKRRDMNSILKAYREELIKKKVIYRGFRPGKVPPYAMPEIRSSVVNHAIATTIGELCFLNGLTICGPNKEIVEQKEDYAYLKDIVQPDSEGRLLQQQLEAWRENNNFTFTAEFYATINTSKDSSTSDDIVESSSINSQLNSDGMDTTAPILETNVIDAEVVSQL